MNNNKNRREAEPLPDKELYQLPKDSIEEFIDKERRHDELDRLREVTEQSRVWWRTVIFCGALNLILILLALSGGMVN